MIIEEEKLMAFPSSPVDGEIYGKFQWNESAGAWEEALEYISFPTDNLVGYYSFDAEDVSDSSGNEHHAAATNVTYALGKAVLAAVFNGSAYITLPSGVYGAVTLQSKWTLVALVNTATLAPTDGFVQVFYFNNGSAKIAITWDDTNNRWYGQITDAAGANTKYVYGNTGTISVDEWHSLILKCDGAGTISFHEDSVLTDTESITGLSDWTATAGYIGGAGATANLEGSVDEARIFDDDLNDSQIETLFLFPGGIFNTDAIAIATNSTHTAGDGSDHSDVADNTTHSGSAGTDHADVGSNNSHRTGDGSDHADVADNTTHSGSAGTDHSDVGLNNTHRGSAGTDHADVGSNNSHRTGDGSDHADVADNTTHAGSIGTDHSNVGLNNTHRGVTTGNPHDVTKTEVGLSNVVNRVITISTSAPSGGANGDIWFVVP